MWMATNDFPCDVRFFGAAGDGVANDQSAIQRAIDATQVTYPKGGTVYLPPGVYRIEGQLSIWGPNVRLLGDAATTIHLATSAENSCAIEVTASGFMMDGLTLEGPTKGAYVANEHGVYAHGPSARACLSGLHITRCEIFSFGSGGVRAQFVDGIVETSSFLHDLGYSGAMHLSCNNGVFSQNRIRAIGPGTSGNMYGVSLTHDSKNFDKDQTENPGCDHWVIAENDIDDVNWAGIDGHLPSNVKVIGNHVRSCRYGIGIDTGSGDSQNYTGHDIAILGNIIEGGIRPNTTPSGGINVGGSSFMQQQRVVVSGNILRGQGLPGDPYSGAIRAYFIDDLVIADNSISDFGNAAIRIGGTINGGVVSGNAIGDGVPPLEQVIMDQADESSTRTFSGNRSSPKGPLPANGLQVTTKPTIGDLIVVGNRFGAMNEYPNPNYITSKWP
jgi:hypothetical protein